MKILLVSNSPWSPTGYGQQGASLARRLRDAGHEVIYYCNYGLEGGTVQWEGITCLPSNGQSYVDPIFKGHLRMVMPDLLITLQDLWPWEKLDFINYIQKLGIRWAAWFPIDALPISQANKNVLSQVTYLLPIANFVEPEIARLAPDVRMTVIPHGIEKAYGYTAAGRQEFRRHLQVPDDAFLFGSVGRNAYYPGRKGFDRLMRAFAEADLPNSYLYIHALTNSEYGSIPLPQIAEFYGITDRVRFADDYNGVMGYSQNGMNALYSAMDCYVQPTLGEGFGIPVLEAQACGAVVIATDCTSMPELLCPDASQLVPGITEMLVPDPSHRVLIDIEKLKDAMREIYEIKRDDPAGFRAMKGRVGLWANGWDWDRIWNEAWVPFLADVQSDIERAPTREYHRGGGLVFEHEGRMRKQDSTRKSPAVSKELAFLNAIGHHPNIIPELDSGTADDGTTWFDMPIFTPLRDVQMDSLSQEQRDRIVDGVRSALVYLHEHQRAHRDVCPENVVVDREYNPYLIDFEWAHPCDGEIGVDCVDFEPWNALDRAVFIMQTGAEQRGFHTIVQYVHGISLAEKQHGFKGVPYQQIDGTGERDCQPRWNLMKPDVAGKSVLDIGCNLGWFVRKSLEEGAGYAHGWDFDEPVLQAAHKLGPGAYQPFNLDKDELPDQHYDVIFALSVLQHLQNPDRVFDWIMSHSKTAYIELPPRFVTERMARDILYAEHCGESERGRPIWKITVREAVPA